MDKAFVRRSFYTQPPTANATPEEWQEWLERDNRQARAAKARHTRSLKATQEDQCDYTTRKVQGVWRSTPVFGYVGEGDQNGHIEPQVEATQELTIDQARARLATLKSAGGRKKSARERRAQKREVRRRGFRG